MPSLLLFVLLCLAIGALTAPEPCKPSIIEKEQLQHVRSITNGSMPLMMCIITPTDFASHLEPIISHNVGHGQFGFQIVVVNDPAYDFQSNCNVVVEIVSELQPSRMLCPEQCFPYPYSRLPRELIESLMNKFNHVTTDIAVSCSLALSMVLGKVGKHSHDKHIVIKRLFRMLFWHRLMECQEHKVWASHRSSNSEAITRRVVEGVVIWIGSQDNLQLIRDQSTVLSGEEYHNSRAIIGWAATDTMYPCTKNGITCNGGGLKHLPKPAINFMPPGWACAQRRPLRALSHVLLLFDPKYVVLIDDDTFLNFKLLKHRFSSYLDGEMTEIPVVIGEYQGQTGPNGHLSTGGSFAGGAGYIIGKKAIDMLVSKEIEYLVSENGKPSGILFGDNEYRSKSQIFYLSVVQEGLKAADQSCVVSQTPSDSTITHPNHTIASSYKLLQSLKQWGLDHYFKGQDTSSWYKYHKKILPLSIRLVDYCTNLMAGENTCYHSDHSLSRCLIYGAGIYPVGIGCQSEAKETPTDFLYGLCFMAKQCELHQHVTCHRYVPDKNGGSTSAPVRLKASNKAMYKVYSSVFNGTLTDTFM